MSTLTDLLKQQPGLGCYTDELAPYADDPGFSSLVEAIKAQPAPIHVLPSALLKAAAQSPLALRILAEKFQIKFDTPPTAEDLARAAVRWYENPPPGVTTSVSSTTRYEASRGASIVALDKVSSSTEAFGVYLGLPQIHFSNLGTLPGGAPGARLVALRFIVANGDFWESHFNWQIPLRSRGVTEPQIEVIRTLVERIRTIAAEEVDTSPEAIAGVVTRFMDTTVDRTDDDTLRFLVAEQRHPEIRQAAQVQLRERAVELYRDHPQATDLLYLATYDITRYPATTVSAGEMKYVIIPIKGEMGARAVSEAISAGKIPVIVYSQQDDPDSLPKRLAEAGGGFAISAPGNSGSVYANAPLVIQRVRTTFQERFGDAAAAELARAALYPGYGGFAENDGAIAAFRQAGIVFVGPMEDVVVQGGDKRNFRTIAGRHAPDHITPGITIASDDPEAIHAQVVEGYQLGKFILPGRLKAANGGGGGGQVVVEGLSTLPKAIDQVRAEIQSKRWTPGVMFEQNIPETVHVEVPLARDRYGHTVCFFQRDCTEQRSSQKVQEEAPPAILRKYPQLGQVMMDLAAKIANDLGYVGAGTVELMFKDGHFYFLEMNTRLQVETPVTEETINITRADGTREPLNLVQLQYAIAEGKPIDFTQEQIVLNGFVAREFRINAETWDAVTPNHRDKKPGTFLPPNYVNFSELAVPLSEAEIAEIVAGLKAQGVTGIAALKVRWDSGFEAGDRLINQDPNFAKLIVCVKPEAGFEDQAYELLRRASLEVLGRVRIRGEQQSLKGVIGEVETNISAHVRILQAPESRRHARGVLAGRHVDWVTDMLRKGSKLDASPYPALMRQSHEGLEVPVVYAVHRDDPHVIDGDTPEVFRHPANYHGLLASHLLRMSQSREGLTLEGLFAAGDLQMGTRGHRVGVAVDPQGNVLNAVLYNRQDLPVSMIVSLETMGVSHLLRINLTYNTIHGTVTDLATGATASINLAHNAEGHYPPFRFTLRGLPSITLEADIDNEHKEVTLRNAEGDYIIRVRPHMAKASADNYFELLKKLADKTLPEAERNARRGELQQTFIDMAIVAGENTETRDRFVSQLAHSPYSLGTEVALMTLYHHDNPELQQQVRSLAYEILFHRYYDTRFHHVDSYEMVSDGESPVIYGTFHDDPEMWVVRRVEGIRHVVWLRVSATENVAKATLGEAIGTELDRALTLLRQRQGSIGGDDVIEVTVPQMGDDKAFATLLGQVVNAKMAGVIHPGVLLRRVTFNIYSRVGDPAYQPGDGFYTFRPTGVDGKYEEASPRHIHPMGAEQMEQWRWIEFRRRPVTSSHRGVQVTEVTARSNPADQRYILGALLRHEPEQVRLDATLLRQYIQALANGDLRAEETLLHERDEALTVPRDLPQRLQDLFRWALYEAGVITDPARLNDSILALRSSGLINDEVIERICTGLDGIIYYVPELEETFSRQIVDLLRLRETEGTHQAHFNNRVQVFVQEPIHVDARGMAFLAYHFRQLFSGLDIDKASVHFRALNGDAPTPNQVFTWRPAAQGINPIQQVDASNETVQPHYPYETAETQLNRTGAYSPRQQAELFFDSERRLQEIVVLREIVVENLGQANERVTEADYDPKRQDVRIRGVIGLVGGRRSLLVTPDLINIGKYVYFDKDDGDLTARYIEYANNDREGNDIVGMPILNVEEINYGANLKTGVKSLVQYGAKFRAVYKAAAGDPRHAYRRANPNVSVVLAKVAGGGGYAPKGSHVTIGIRGMSVIVLTGAKASAAEAGGVPVYRKGKIEVGGVPGKFDEDRVGSTEGPGRRRIFTAVVSTPKIEQLLMGEEGEKRVPVAKVAEQLTSDDLLEAKRTAFEEARYFTLLEGDRVDSLLPSNMNTAEELTRMSLALSEYVNDPFFSLKRGDVTGLAALVKAKGVGAGGAVPSFVPVLEDLAIKDSEGRPILRFWADGSEDASLGDNLRCGFVALPIEQTDGTVRVEVVGFKVNPARSKTGGAITIEAAKKDAAFTKIVSNLGLAMIRFSGSDGFFSTEQQELDGIEADGAQALAEVIDADEHHPQAVTYTLEIKKNQGGARIFSAGEELSDKGAFVTDALNLDTIRLAAIGPAATAMVTATTPFTIRVQMEKKKEVPGETDEQRGIRIDAALLDEHAKQTEKAIPAGTVAQAVKDGGIRSAVSPLYARRAISSGILEARQQRLLYEETGAHLKRWGIDYVQARTNNGRFDLKGQFRINGRDETYDAAGIKDTVARLQRIENLATLAGKKMVTTRDGRALVDGVEYATPEAYIRVAGLHTLLGGDGTSHGNPTIHQGPERSFHHAHAIHQHGPSFQSMHGGVMAFAGADVNAFAESDAMMMLE